VVEAVPENYERKANIVRTLDLVRGDNANLLSPGEARPATKPKPNPSSFGLCDFDPRRIGWRAKTHHNRSQHSDRLHGAIAPSAGQKRPTSSSGLAGRTRHPR